MKNISSRTKKIIAAGTLVLAGFGGGSALALTGAANAADDTSASASDHDGGKGETPLTGATADKVEAAALAKYPGATIDRLETDNDGVYEAHVTTTDDQELIVQVGEDFTVTGTDQGGHGDHDGDGPDADQGATQDGAAG